MWRNIAIWLSGLVVILALIFIVLHVGELERFWQLVQSAQPQWLAIGLVAQLGTYICLAAVWHACIRARHEQLRFINLIPLGLAKLFLDQTVPSGGITGTMLVIRRLEQKGISRETAMGAFLVVTMSFYAANLLVMLASVVFLWGHREVSQVILIAVTTLVVVSIAIPAGLLWLRRLGRRVGSSWIERLPAFRAMIHALAEAPSELLKNRQLLARALGWQLAILVLDVATMWLMFRAIGHPVEIWIAFVGFAVAAALAIVGPMPLGPFEAGSVGMLTALGVPVETSLTATLLTRGLTFWLPLLPGLWFARKQLRKI